jgi:deoxyribodipyrimidine photolyase-related protein
MSLFLDMLSKRQRDPSGRRWIFVPYDQLTDKVGPLSREDPGTIGIVLAETSWKGNRRPYHRQKLALILSNLRHFALEQAERGVGVEYVFAHEPYRVILEKVIQRLGPLSMMTPAERELRVDLKPLVREGGLTFLPHEAWMTGEELLLEKTPPWRMDGFYRAVRRDTGVLMRSGKPEGGKYSFDAENRLPWRGDPPAPVAPAFPADPIKEEVGRVILKKFKDHPGRLDLASLPASRTDAERMWTWAKRACLPCFGPYEDAMSAHSSGLFHTRLSSLMNICRLLPREILEDVEEADLPVQSKEGFVRQILGWREFVRHVHLRTDGFRSMPDKRPPVAGSPGDGGYKRWSGGAWSSTHARGDPDGGARPSLLGGRTPLPPAFWGEPSGLTCLDHVVSCVWKEGYSHHITRLMILANVAALLDVSPRELTDWFWIAYTDAYDWVVEPNVLGMGSYAVGDLMTTKPYVSGTPYILRMSDYCRRCGFDPKKNCPLSSLYWAFLLRHEEALKDNPRMRVPVSSLRRRSRNACERDLLVFRRAKDLLASGGKMSPKDFLF